MTSDPRLRRQQATATPPVPPPPPPEPEPDSTRMGLDGTADDIVPQNQQNGDNVEGDGFKLRFCTVCASNNNRYVGILASLGCTIYIVLLEGDNLGFRSEMTNLSAKAEIVLQYTYQSMQILRTFILSMHCFNEDTYPRYPAIALSSACPRLPPLICTCVPHYPATFKLTFPSRSMEAHLRLASPPHSFPVISFGTGSLVRLPGPSLNQPNVYQFNTTSYSTMHSELLSKDPRLYRANGVLQMLERNRNVKWGPERWQDWIPGMPRVGPRGTDTSDGQNGDGGAAAGVVPTGQIDRGSAGVEAGWVDVVITCEERCWDAVVDDLYQRPNGGNRPVHVINVDIKDNHEEALIGGNAILDLARRLNRVAREERERSGAGGWEGGGGTARQGFDERVPEVVAEWQEKWPGLPALWTLAWF